MQMTQNMSLADWFVPFPASQYDAAMAAYDAHLAARDGVPDFPVRQLTQREATMTRLRQDRGMFQGRIDPARFTAHMQTAHRHKTPAPDDLPLDLLFVFTCIRANTYEAYSVEQLLAQSDGAYETVRQRINVIIMLEEYYHTRFLLSIADLFALSITEPPPPPFVVQALIAGLRYFPTSLALPLTLCSEIIGLALFVKLFELAGTIFATEPAIRDAIEMRLGEVIADELGHISYNRLHLGRTGMQVAQRLLPLVANGARHGMPGAAGLGLYPFPFAAIANLHTNRLPQFIREQAFIA